MQRLYSRKKRDKEIVKERWRDGKRKCEGEI
jgi:hypothetical protein